MKRIMVLCLVMALMATMAIGVSATTLGQDNYPDETTNKYTVTLALGEDYANQMFGFVALPAGQTEISESSIVYIDQATANSAGTVVFEGFLPKGADPANNVWVECDLFIGGGNLAAASAGTLKAAIQDDNNPITISGTITDTFSSRVATITVLNGETVVGTTTAAVADGTYSVEVEAGTYAVKCDKDAYLPFTYTGVEVDEDGVVVDFDMTALAGDVNDNGEVNMNDLGFVLDDYNKVSSEVTLLEAKSDINNNGEVNMNDLGAILDTYNQTSRVVEFTTASN